MDELLEKLKGIEPWKRFLIITVVIIGIITYFMIDKVNILEEERQKIEAKKLTTKTKLQEALSKKNKIPEIKKQLNNIQDDLEKAKKIIPDNINMDEVLNTISTYAKEVGILINYFKPEEEKVVNAGIQYVEVPISMEFEGKFQDILLLYDKIIHIDNIVNLHNLSFTGVTNIKKENNNTYKETIVKAKVKLVLFKSAKAG